jgi:hypothetical protein
MKNKKQYRVIVIPAYHQGINSQYEINNTNVSLVHDNQTLN